MNKVYSKFFLLLVASFVWISTVCNDLQAQSQNLNNNWTFGDSCGINFNASGIVSYFKSNSTGRGTCITVSDTSGNLLFYATSPDKALFIAGGNLQLGVVFNSNHQAMQNGRYLKTTGWYREMQVIPRPGFPEQYILFLAGEESNIFPGLRYAIIDMQQNNGLGAVTQKNVQIDNRQMDDGMLAIQHGNGRDWWLLYKTWDQTSNEFKKLLIDPSGIHVCPSQFIGVSQLASFWRLILSPASDQIMSLSNAGLLEYFSFDRCTGVLDSTTTLLNVPLSSLVGEEVFWDGEYSPSGRYFYAGTLGIPGYLYQFDLQDSTPWANRVILDTISVPAEPGNALRLAPDGRIYRAIAWNDGVNYNYPYPDTTYNLYNTHLGVINYPDSAGIACDYQGFSVALPSYCRTYLGLPANVNFNKGKLIGSICDTLGTVSINELIPWEGVTVYPNPCYNKIGFNLPNTLPEQIRLLDITGKEVQKFIFDTTNNYLRELDLSTISQGTYFIEFRWDKKNIIRKIVKQ